MVARTRDLKQFIIIIIIIETMMMMMMMIIKTGEKHWKSVPAARQKYSMRKPHAWPLNEDPRGSQFARIMRVHQPEGSIWS